MIIKEKDIKTAENVLKDCFRGLLQQMPGAELEGHLTYYKYNHENKNTSNSRNGRSKKTMKSNLDMFDLDIPRDSDSSFEPKIIKKHQTNYIA